MSEQKKVISLEDLKKALEQFPRQGEDYGYDDCEEKWLHIVFVDGFVHGYKHALEEKESEAWAINCPPHSSKETKK